MFLIVYDMRDDKLRTRFAKFLKQFGRRLQYSVFEIANSPRILSNIRVEMERKFEKHFGQSDSVLIYDVPDNACVGRFGYPVNEEGDLVMSG
jgi:CRISPR-associated protein Cas2